MTSFSLRNVAAVCGAIFVLALAYLILAEGHAAGAVFGAFSEQSFPAKLAWLIVVVVPLVLIPAAVWLGETLVRQRQAALALELRLDGVRQNVKGLVKSQVEAEMAVHQLVRTDPEDAVNAIQQRLTEAGALLQTQQGRNEIGDLDSRVEAVRSRQQALQQRLGPIVEKRRSIEQLFVDLDTRQHDIERALAEIAGGGDAVALDIGLKKMTDFVRQSHDRCDEIERASQMIAGLQQDFTGLQTRLTPLADSAEGVVRRVKDLSVARDQLADEIASLEQTAQGPLAARVQKFADDRKLLDDRLSQLTTQFARLATVRKEIEGLFANFDRALDSLGETTEAEGEVDIDARVQELAAYIEATQAHIDEIERRSAAFGQIRSRLGELQARLNPLEAADGGVVSVIGELRQIRDRLFTRIKQIEEDEDGGLAERVKKFGETKRELEDRVANLTEEFSRLATIRRDIAGLFEKLSGAVNASAN